MSVEREDSRGDRDLYVSFHERRQHLDRAFNLGDIVNTAAEESAPFPRVR